MRNFNHIYSIIFRGNKIKSGYTIAECIGRLTDLTDVVLYLSENQIKKGGEILKEFRNLGKLNFISVCLR